MRCKLCEKNQAVPNGVVCAECVNAIIRAATEQDWLKYVRDMYQNEGGEG